MTRHRQLLQQAVKSYLPNAERLRGAEICVTGASGFLAASLLAFLHELNVVGNLEISLHANARRSMNEVKLFKFLKIEPEIDWVVAAVENAKLPKVDDLIVIHTASYGSPIDYMREPIATYEANTQGLMNLFGQGVHLRQFMYFSSAEIYGQPPQSMIPTPETYLGGLDTLAPRSIYGESKRMAEVLGGCLGRQQGVPFAVIRPWSVYGPGQRINDGRVPMDFVAQAKAELKIHLMSNGSPTRTFCHVWDAIPQITSVIGKKEDRVAFNIGNNSEEISMLELARQCAKASGLDVSAVSFDVKATTESLQRCMPDITEILNQLPPVNGFISLENGLATMVEWHDYNEPANN